MQPRGSDAAIHDFPAPESHLLVNLQSLQVFCEVVRQQSFSRGAGALGISQSAASQLVAHLEKELGFRLLERSRPPRPTEEGRMYYSGCQEILHRHRAVLEEIRRRQKRLEGTLRVASIYSAGLHTLRHHIEEFERQHPEVKIRLDYCQTRKVYEAVLEEEADIGLVSYPEARRGLIVRVWQLEEMVVVCPPEHPLAGRTGCRLEDLRGSAYVAFDTDLTIRREIDRTLRKRHVTVRVVSEFDNIETIKQALEISAAISILPKPSVQREIRRGTLVDVRVGNLDLWRPLGLIRRRRQGLTPTGERFLDNLLQNRSAG